MVMFCHEYTLLQLNQSMVFHIIYELFTSMNRGGSQGVWIIEGPLYYNFSYRINELAN